MRNAVIRPIALGILLFGMLLVVGLTSAQEYEPGQEYVPGKSENIVWDSGGIAPYADAPKCGYHDPREWHGLWNPRLGCYYDHEHKDNPGVLYEGMPSAERVKAEQLIRVFGKPGAWFYGKSISYPWQTFKGANPNYPEPNGHNENSTKHEGYGWISEVNLPQVGAFWIRDYRIQYHAIFGSLGAVTRYHSYSLEANICSWKGCNLVRTGGWLDFGQLFVAGRKIDIPGQEGDGVRRRMHTGYNHWYETNVDLFQSPAFWYGRSAHPNQLAAGWRWDGAQHPFERVMIALETADTWGYINGDNPHEDIRYCPDAQCNKNGSSIKVHRLEIFTDLLEWEGYTDRYGLINDECVRIGLDCIPTLIEVDTQQWLEMPDSKVMREFDVSPPGVWWIEYPN